MRAGGRRGRDPRAHPDERPLRVVERARRHVRPGRVRRLYPGISRARLERQVGRRFRPRTSRRSRSTCSACSGWRSSGVASAGCRWRPRSPSRGPRIRSPSTSSNSNTNDALLAAVPDLGLLARRRRPGRAGSSPRSPGWTKFGALLVAPLWAATPSGAVRRPRGPLLFAAGFAAATLAAFSILLLEPDLGHAARVFWDRTLAWQFGRESPFSIWDWRQYHAAGIPDLQLVQLPLIGLVLAGAVSLRLLSAPPLAAAARRADRRDPGRL